ncbi:arsenate reductase (glutaredoxin) [Pseudoalteromonas sp. MMG013]|uniref:Arsenate reductase n=1 Tax=Pseudoalteromonas aurantia 208 TaxID=1314867 RepID=A0ABR9E922_9GAMM|nr:MULTISPECIES: arsenate reductase (glutaredoxin) [Pseudoalteromonas]MBE0367484.1 arsenate reductase [Pseudoalteromonas aurantia 208]MBQ4845854.1 arsenate reductase (glutaredoxin) [Pseudoalteromonas sp. MMG005]MBQ4849108.1 arsenate reductase (glutaredoxin) [Pseudoalteromonas sp. MMG012]MBQ4861887.1 arsenate reductase (glutaredoxin) [Pseudoalteromonas sp. MMG013]
MSVTIYHNPRCSKSRETLALLETQGVTPTIVEYLKTPINLEQLETLLTQLSYRSAHQLVRNKEALYKELALTPETPESTLKNAMIDNPKLIERPIVVSNNQAAIGRPPESVLAIL